MKLLKDKSSCLRPSKFPTADGIVPANDSDVRMMVETL